MKIFFWILGTFALLDCSSSQHVDLNNSLENTNWILTEFDGKPYNQNDATKPVSLKLQSEENRIVGFGGCNSFSGSYTVDGNTIQFTLMSTKMFCSETMQVEDFLFKTLTKVEYSVDGDFLTLKNIEGQSVRFKKN